MKLIHQLASEQIDAAFQKMLDSTQLTILRIRTEIWASKALQVTLWLVALITSFVTVVLGTLSARPAFSPLILFPST